MGNVNGWRVVGMGGVEHWGNGSSANKEDWERLLFKLSSTSP